MFEAAKKPEDGIVMENEGRMDKDAKTEALELKVMSEDGTMIELGNNWAAVAAENGVIVDQAKFREYKSHYQRMVEANPDAILALADMSAEEAFAALDRMLEQLD